MVGNHDVLVAVACLDGVSSGVVSEELVEWEVHDVELVGEGQFRGLAAWIDTWFLSVWCICRRDYCKAI